MTPDLPAPLVPAEADLRAFPYLPLDVVRLRDSRLTATATGDEFRAAVLLWCAAWHQVPASSLPQDERELASLAGYGRDLKGWRKVRGEAMRGWEPASDGRLYHEVVTEKALEAWKQRQGQKAKAQARWNKPGSAVAHTAADPTAHAAASPVHMQENRTDREEIEKGIPTPPAPGTTAPDEHDIGAPSALTPAASADADRWGYVRAEAWAKSLVAAGCKLGPQNWPAWKSLTERWPTAQVVQIAAALPATERWPDRTEVALRASGGQAPIGTALNVKNVRRIEL